MEGAVVDKMLRSRYLIDKDDCDAGSRIAFFQSTSMNLQVGRSIGRPFRQMLFLDRAMHRRRHIALWHPPRACGACADALIITKKARAHVPGLSRLPGEEEKRHTRRFAKPVWRYPMSVRYRVTARAHWFLSEPVANLLLFDTLAFVSMRSVREKYECELLKRHQIKYQLWWHKLYPKKRATPSILGAQRQPFSCDNVSLAGYWR